MVGTYVLPRCSCFTNFTRPIILDESFFNSRKGFKDDEPRWEVYFYILYRCERFHGGRLWCRERNRKAEHGFGPDGASISF